MALNRRRLTTKVTITSPVVSDEPLTDDYGNEIPETESEDVWGLIWVTSGSEVLTNRDTQVNNFNGLFPPEVSIQALSTLAWTDRFGVDHEGTIEGEPLRHSGMRGPHSIGVIIKEVVS